MRTPDIGRIRFWCEGGEWLSEPDRRPFVFADLDAVGEGLVRESLALVVLAGVEVGAADQEAEGCAELFACPGVVVVFAVGAAVDVGEPGADAVLMVFEGIEVDRRRRRSTADSNTSALGFRNLINYITRSLLETGGFSPHLHPRLR